MKIKALIPTLREKKRYLAFEVISKTNFTFQDVARSINNSFTQFFGELSFGKAGLQVLPENYDANKGILRVTHDFLNQASASLALIPTINNQSVIVRSLKASGAINKLKNV